MKINLLLTAVLFFSSVTLINNVSAETYQYKWKDSNGEVHYTERPPAQGIQFETIRIKTSVSTQPTTETNIKKTTEQKSSDEQAHDEKYNNWRAENCKRAIQNLDVLENAGRIAQDDGQGGTRLMSDEEKQEKIKTMTEQKEKYCADAPEAK